MSTMILKFSKTPVNGPKTIDYRHMSTFWLHTPGSPSTEVSSTILQRP